MARLSEAELATLGVVYYVAFQRKQCAHAVVDAVWVQRSNAYTTLSCAYEAKQRAYGTFDQARHHLRSIRDNTEVGRYTEEIRSAKELRDLARTAFDQALQEFRAAEWLYHRLKAEFEQARAEFWRLQVEADAAQRAYCEGIEQLEVQGVRPAA